MFFKFLLYALLLYMLYRLVFYFIIPIYKTTRQVKQQFREMHSRMEESMNREQSSSSPSQKQEEKKEKVGDYIDFEEVK